MSNRPQEPTRSSFTPRAVASRLTASALSALSITLVACGGDPAPPPSAAASPSGTSDASAGDQTPKPAPTSAPSAAPAPSPSATPSASPSATPSATPSEPLETKVLTLEPRALKVVGDVVLFEPDRNVKRARYDTYRFDKTHFVEKLGGTTLKVAKKVKVEVRVATSANKSPSDPKLSAPVGGFELRTYECRIVSVE